MNFTLKTAALWIVRIASAALFLMAGSAKLTGGDAEVFAKIGLGQWFRYFTGVLEALGAILLVTPLALYGAALLVPVMVGAAATHIFIVGGSPAMALVLLAAMLFVVWGKWGGK